MQAPAALVAGRMPVMGRDKKSYSRQMKDRKCELFDTATAYRSVPSAKC